MSHDAASNPTVGPPSAAGSHHAPPARGTGAPVIPPWRRLVVVGDSVAAGIGDRVEGWAALTWVDRLVTSLDRPGGTELLNLGVPGRRAGQVRAEQLGPALAFAADLAIVVAGGNDALRRGFDASTVAADLDAIVGALTQQDALVVTFGLFDLSCTRLLPEAERPGLGRRIRDLNAQVREVTARHGGVHVDFHGALAADPSLISEDQVHPNHRGQAHMGARVRRALGRWLEGGDPGRREPVGSGPGQHNGPRLGAGARCARVSG